MWKDSETELDFLDYDYLVNILMSTINNQALLPASIGVYGDWGSGKSSLLYMCKKRLEETDEKVKCLMFNGWLFESYDDAKSAILGSILDEIAEDKKLSEKAKDILKGLYSSVDKFKLIKNGIKTGVDFLATGGVATVADITIKSVLKNATTDIDDGLISKIKDSVNNELNNKELRNDIRKFQKEFSELLKATNITKLVVFIDELDRCNPDTILDTLEAIKLFMFRGNVAFVIGADERHISYAVNKKYKNIEGTQISIGKEYLEKLIQYPIKIPKLNEDEVEIYIACLFLQEELPSKIFNDLILKINETRKRDFTNISLKEIVNEIEEQGTKINAIESVMIAKQLSSVLAKGLNGNPRQCKRFLNSLDMRMRMAQYKNKELNRSILAKIMMLEYIKPNLFKTIAELFSLNKLSSELAIMEGEKKDDDLTELKIWHDDEWVKKWCKIEPAIANEDLTLYFYFTRTSLDEKIEYMNSKLSPSAQQILDNLLSKSDAQIKHALAKFNEVNANESAKILEIVFNNIISDQRIDKDKFKAFIKWSKISESLYSESLSYLMTLKGKKISMGLIPIIIDFAKDIGKVTEMREIADMWILDNPKIEKAFESLRQEG